MIEYFTIPTHCPYCNSVLEIKGDFLKCTNSQCQGKLVNRLDHFCSKKGLDIVGLSKATLEKLIDWGWLNNLIDIFNLSNYKIEWIAKPGFGQASVDKILIAIENSKNTTLDKFIAALGIPLIGSRVAKDITQKVHTYSEFKKLIDEKFDFSQWEGFADSKTEKLLNFDYSEADEIYKLLNIADNAPAEPTLTQVLTICITGNLKHYKNRTELQNAIESIGGKVVSSISKKVNYLINNDINSTSGKNQQAKKFNIPIISEEEFIKKFFDL